MQTGEPIFRKVINRVDIRFDYLFVADRPSEISGLVSWDALLVSEAGWQRQVPLQDETAFRSNGTSLQTVLDLAEIQQMIDGIQLQTGVASSRYELQIRPRVAIAGVLAGENVQDSFAPVLAFQMDTQQLSLARANGVDQLRPTQEGYTLRQVESPGKVRFLTFQAPVSALRTFSAAGALAAFLGTLVAFWSVRQRRRRPAIEQIRERFGPLLITVKDSSLGMGNAMVHLASIDDLAKVAERTGQMILCVEEPATWHFSVYDESVVYRFEVERQDGN